MSVPTKSATQIRNEQVLARDVQAGQQAAHSQFWKSSHEFRMAANGPVPSSSMSPGYRNAFNDMWKRQRQEYAKLRTQPQAGEQSTAMVIADNRLAEAEAGADLRKSRENLKTWLQAHPLAGSSSGPQTRRGVSPATAAARATTAALQNENTEAAKRYAEMLDRQRRG